jgi:hypothetical protein
MIRAFVGLVAEAARRDTAPYFFAPSIACEGGLYCSFTNVGRLTRTFRMREADGEISGGTY